MPEWKEEIRQRLVGLKLEPTREAEIVEELAQHLEDRYSELRASGANEAQALHVALAEASQSELLKRELVRSQPRAADATILGSNRGSNIIEDLWRDLSYCGRMLRRNPSYSLVAILTIGLGIGVNTAVFSLANALLLRAPQGVNQPESIALLGRTSNGSDFGTFSYPDYADLRDQNTSFAHLAAFREVELHLTTGGAPERLSGMLISGNYFTALGTRADAGRTLLPEDDGTHGSSPVAVISHGLWERQFGSDPNIVGEVISLNNFSFTVVGVLEQGFMGTRVAQSIDVWLPLTMYSQADPAFFEKRFEARHISWLSVLGRLKPGVTPRQARSEMSVLAGRLEKIYPETDKGLGVALVEGLGLQPQRRNEARSRMLILLAVSGLVLLIVCANLANLSLARGAARRREIAIRLAMGAARGRLIRQLLTEALLTSTIGGVLGIVLAFWSRDLLLSSNVLIGVRLSPHDLRFDARVLSFTLLVALATGIIFGLIPALESSRLELNSMLKERSAIGLQLSRIRGALVVGQIALSVVILICSVLFVKTLRNAESVEPGFDIDKILAMPIDVGRRGYSEAQGRLFYRQLVERVSSIPGVGSASLSVTVPLGGSWRTGFRFEGQPPAEPDVQCDYDIVAPGYFETTGIALINGRDFTERDDKNSSRVVIVNEEFARRGSPHDNPLGKRLNIPRSRDDNSYSEIIGVVKDIKYERLTELPRPYFYLPLSQQYQSGATLLIRSKNNDASDLIIRVGQEVQALDRNLPVRVVRLAERLVESLAPQRSAAKLFGMFGSLAILLASIGLYGVLSYQVSQRTNEIGVRMTFGANAWHILKLVVGEGFKLAMIGIAVGLAAAYALTRLMSQLLFGVSAQDPMTFALIGLLLTGVALGASSVPALRATKVDPMVALRHE